MKVRDILTVRPVQQGEGYSAVASISPQRPASPPQSAPSRQEAGGSPTCACGYTIGIWLFNRGTCWERYVCRQCQGAVSMPTAHLCAPALPLTAPCKGHGRQLVSDTWTCSGCGQGVALTETDEHGHRHFVCSHCGSFAVVPQEPGRPYTPLPGESFTPGPRDFLPRPLGQEGGAWDAWAPFFDWLIEHYPDRYHGICEAEEAIRALERAGVTEGWEYETACAELLKRFEEARWLKMKAGFKIWFQ